MFPSVVPRSGSILTYHNALTKGSLYNFTMKTVGCLNMVTGFKQPTVFIVKLYKGRVLYLVTFKRNIYRS
jgi:hypothetical protein